MWVLSLCLIRMGMAGELRETDRQKGGRERRKEGKRGREEGDEEGNSMFRDGQGREGGNTPKMLTVVISDLRFVMIFIFFFCFSVFSKYFYNLCILLFNKKKVNKNKNKAVICICAKM